MPEGEFAFFRFVGGRYRSGEGMPIEGLAELVIYRELVAEVARDVWKRSHPARQRAPKNFGDQLDLVITGFADGSVRPLLTRREVHPSLVGDEFDEGREVVTRAIMTAATTGELPGDFPRSCVAKLTRLGRSLRSGDRIQFGHPEDNNRRAELNRAVADILRRIGEELSTEQPETRLRGHIVEMDVEAETFELRVSRDHRVVATYDGADADRVRGWLTIDGDEGTLVEVRGTALVDGEGEVQRFVGPTTIRDLPLDGIVAVFTTMAGIDAEVGVPREVARIVNELSERIARHYPRFGIAWMPDGYLRVEWTTSQAVECSAEFGEDQSLYLHLYDPRDGTDQEWQGGFDEHSLQVLDGFLEGGRLA